MRFDEHPAAGPAIDRPWCPVESSRHDEVVRWHASLNPAARRIRRRRRARAKAALIRTTMTETYDVIVAGGDSGGVAAALATGMLRASPQHTPRAQARPDRSRPREAQPAGHTPARTPDQRAPRAPRSRGHCATGSRYRGIRVAPDPGRWLAVMCRGAAGRKAYWEREGISSWCARSGIG